MNIIHLKSIFFADFCFLLIEGKLTCDSRGFGVIFFIERIILCPLFLSFSGEISINFSERSLVFVTFEMLLYYFLVWLNSTILIFFFDFMLLSIYLIGKYSFKFFSIFGHLIFSIRLISPSTLS